MVLTGVFTLHSLTLYQGGLLAQLVRQQPYVPVVHGLDDVVAMIANKQAVLDLGYPDWAYAQLVMNATAGDGVWYDLKMAIRHNPPIIREIGTPYTVDFTLPMISVDGYREPWFGLSYDDCDFVQVDV